MIDQRLLVLLLVALWLAILLSLCAVLLLRQDRRSKTLTARFRAIRLGQSQTEPRAGRWTERLLASVASVGNAMARFRLIPAKTLREAEMLLAGANMRGETVLAAFLGGKTLLLILLPPLFWFLSAAGGAAGNVPVLAAVLGGAAAIVGPDLVLGHRRKLRLAAVQRGLPDALDLLVICADAGLAFDTALERVTKEIAPVHPEVSQEFGVTANALRIAPDRRAVLIEMGARLDVEFLKRLAATLAQSLQIGAPLARSLRALAQELRQEQMLRFEEKAARLPVLLTVPMVLFILPTVLLVIGGPAVVQMIRAFQ